MMVVLAKLTDIWGVSANWYLEHIAIPCSFAASFTHVLKALTQCDVLTINSVKDSNLL